MSRQTREFMEMALSVKGCLYDTRCSNGCLHGAPSIDSQVRKKCSNHLTLYFTQRMEDEEEGAPTGFTNLAFMERFPEAVDSNIAKLVLADAANAILERSDYDNARMLTRLHIGFDMWSKNDGASLYASRKNNPKSPARSVNDMPSWALELGTLLQTVETPEEVTKYIL